MNLQRLKENFKNHGLKDFLSLALVRAVNKIFYFNALTGMTLDVKDISKDFFEIPEGYSAKFLSAEESHAISQNPENDLPADFVDLALSKGDRCFAVLHADKLASYGWYSSRPTIFSNKWVLNFDPSWVYMYRGYTLPAYRGKRLHAIGIALALRYYSENGSKGLISYVEIANISSLKSVYRMGYKPIGHIFIVGEGSFSKSFATAGCRKLGLELSKS